MRMASTRVFGRSYRSDAVLARDMPRWPAAVSEQYGVDVHFSKTKWRESYEPSQNAGQRAGHQAD